MSITDATDTTARHVIVSGGSRGLGQALVQGLLTAGYRVSTFSRQPTEFTHSLANEPNFFFQPGDVSNLTHLDEFVQQAIEKLGGPFALINCAGFALDGLLAMMPDDQIDQLLTVNLAGTLHLTRRVVRQMLLGSGGGAIINISSIIGLRGYRGLSAYAATKAGMDGMTRSLARELGKKKIRVNSIAPGYLATEMTHGLDDVQRHQIINRTPLGRLGTPADVVGPVLFLLSEPGSFITGQVLVVDGGITC